MCCHFIADAKHQVVGIITKLCPDLNVIQESVAPVQSVSFVVHGESVGPSQQNIAENLEMKCYLRSRI